MVVSSLRPGRWSPREDPVPIIIGGWVDPRAGLDGCENQRKCGVTKR